MAVDHVRDELLTPADRSSRDRMALWRRAVQFIREKESRVSTPRLPRTEGGGGAVGDWPPAAGAIRDVELELTYVYSYFCLLLVETLDQAVGC